MSIETLQNEAPTDGEATGASRLGQLPLVLGDQDFGTITDTVCAVAESRRPPQAWYIAMGISLTLLGVFGVAILYLIFTGVGVWGVDNSSGWGFAIVNFVFWIGIGHAGTLISAILYLFRQKWRTSINRFAEAMTIFAVICALTFAGVHVGRIWVTYWLLPIPNEMAMWPNFSSPLLWDLFAVSTYFTVSLLFWYTGLIPDLATFRDRATTRTKKFLYGFFALGWNGSSRHWHRFHIVYLLLAGLATPLVLSVHSVVSFDFAVAQTPGWHTTIFPPYFVAGAVFGGFAMVITLAIPARQVFGLKNIITMKHLENMNKVLLCTSLIVGYAYTMELFVAWYSGNQAEFFAFKNRALGPYGWAYAIMIVCNVIAPQFHWFKGVRTNIWAMFAIALCVDVGMWFERFVIVTTLTAGFIPASWEFYQPTLIDVLTLMGSFGLFFTLFLLFVRYLPIVAIAEVKTVMPQAHGEHAHGEQVTTQHHELHRVGEFESDTQLAEPTPHHHQASIPENSLDSIERDGRSKLQSLLVEFDTVDGLKSAARRVRDAGFQKWDTYSPFPVHGIDKAMGLAQSRLPWVVLACGITGCLVGLIGQWWLNSTQASDYLQVPNFLRGYDFRISGKPLWKLPANIPVIFELTVLFAAVGAFVALIAANNLPLWNQALFTKERFKRVTNDRFFLRILATDKKFNVNETEAFLSDLSETQVERVEALPSTAAPQWISWAGLFVVCLALLPPAFVYKAYVSRSSEPRIQIVPDMDNQGRFKAQQSNPFFADGRSMRVPIVGTIARSDAWALDKDPHFFKGKIGEDFVTTFPSQIDVSEKLFQRGQGRFNIYCAACHGYDGSGNGLVAQRVRNKSEIATGWAPPISLHDGPIRARPVGYFFDVITNGIRTMPAHGDQIPTEDRWAIAAYIQALQRSQNATVNDVPEDKRGVLK